jgi:hypothetical protein
VDRRVLLKHTGTYVFDYQVQDKLYNDLHQIALTNQQVQKPAEVVPEVRAEVLASSDSNS